MSVVRGSVSQSAVFSQAPTNPIVASQATTIPISMNVSFDNGVLADQVDVIVPIRLTFAPSFAVAAGNIPTVTMPAVPAGVTSRKIYLTAANGLTNTETLYGTQSSPGTTYNLSAAQAAGVAQTAANTTPLPNPAVAPTVNTTGGTATSGLLQAGNYLLKYTDVTATGETLPSPESASFTVAAGNAPRVTMPAVPAGVTSRKIYLTAAGGATNTETLYATQATPGTTFDLLAAQAAGAAVPSSNTTALPNPATTPTATATGGSSTGGLLQAGTYLLKYTDVNAAGETTVSPESAALTVAAGNIPRVTMPAVPAGVTARKIYLTVAGGSTNTETLYATQGTPALTFDLAVAQSAGAAVPGSNTTATANPATTPTVNPTTGGTSSGLLQAGTYYAKYTDLNAAGETLSSPESLSFAVAAGNLPRVTMPAVPAGVTSRKIYLTSAGGPTNTETLYATQGTPGTTFDLLAAQSAGAALPSANTSALSNPAAVPTVNPTGGGASGGLLQAGTYYVKYTDVTVTGETLPSPESAVATPQTIDLRSLTDIFGAAVNFARARTFDIKIRTTNDAASLTIGADATTPWTGFLNAAGTLTVPPASAANPAGGGIVITAPNTTGMPVTGSSNRVKFLPSAHPITADLVVVGCSV
jgi:hypothetical protein